MTLAEEASLDESDYFNELPLNAKMNNTMRLLQW